MVGWKLHQLKNKSYDEIQELFDQAMIRVNTFIDMDSDVLEGSSKRSVEINHDEEEVAVDAIPLATKPPVIVDYKIHKEEKTGYYKMTRADRSFKLYKVFSQLLKSFDREDLETLWRLVKAKHGDTRPIEGYERVLWGDLKVMFEPHVEDAKNSQVYGRIVGIQKLLEAVQVTTAQAKLKVSTIKVRITAAKLNLVLFSNLVEIYAK
ncbi:hypothetical protein Tco_1174129 [Tanacetum coccineum]